MNRGNWNPTLPVYKAFGGSDRAEVASEPWDHSAYGEVDPKGREALMRDRIAGAVKKPSIKPLHNVNDGH